MVFVQERRVEAGGIDLSDFDLDITVRRPKDDPLEFEVSVWNLTDESWGQIEEHDLCRIELGWVDGETDVVCFGEITSARPQPDSPDVRYDIEGIDESEAAVEARPGAWSKKTWRDKSPDKIVGDIAREIGLSASTESVDRAISGTWSVTSEKKIRRWLDELLEYAAEFTGQSWEWFADRGQLYFQPRDAETVEAPRLAYDSILISLSETSTEDEEVDEELEFEAMLDPRIRKGAAVFVDTDAREGPYRVDDYEFRSSSVTGDHLVRGKLLPIEGDYSVDI